MAKNKLSDKVFVKRLNEILENNYSNEEFGVKALAVQIGLSHTQLHRKIKAEFGKSTSQYIREFRLEKAKNLLSENVGSAAEVSYKVGFNSPTYFNKCFNTYFGYTPGEAKYISNAENRKVKNTELSAVKGWLVGTVLFITALLTVLIATFYGGRQPKSNPEEISNAASVAVLPFKVLSADKNNEYFADGVMDDIINHLSAIKKLRVISRTTMDQYRNTTKTIPEIGEELKVSYVIESSIQRYKDSVRLIIQLIDAEKDQHLWSKDFTREFANLFSLETEIAKHIAKELKATISPSEINRIERAPTKNMEAYNLYIQGKYSFDSNDNNDLLNYRDVLHSCLDLDADFSSAYAALARIKIQRMRAGYLRRSEKEIEAAKALALKAIEIDNNARGHASLGWLYLWFEWNWEAAEKQFRLAIDENPNYAGGYIYLSQLIYNIKGDFDGARKYIDLALYLSPLEYYPRLVSAYFYFNDGDFNKSIAETQWMKQINIDNGNAYYKNFLSYGALGENRKALDELIQGWKKQTGTLELIPQLEEVYTNKGINEVYLWLSNNRYKSEDRSESLYTTAQYYALAGDKERALECLEESYERRDPQMPFIKYDRLFRSLHDDPGFLALIDKMNFSY